MLSTSWKPAFSLGRHPYACLGFLVLFSAVFLLLKVGEGCVLYAAGDEVFP